ncbi:MAG TPA: hypothetical protein VMV49_18725 [Candidatus Deferrimicrobium sp.]|nr:hypothetical protein [Candidatus Deferrimicrobium sp.]
MVDKFLDPVGEPILWFMVSIIFGIVTVYFINKYRKMEASSRSFIFGVIVFASTFMVARTIETIRRYFGVGYYYEGLTITGLNLIVRLIYYLILWIGICSLYFVFEKYVLRQKTRYLLTIFSIITFVLSWSLYLTGGAQLVFGLYMACFFIVALFPIGLFAYCSRTSLDKMQKYAWIFMIIGFGLLLVGILGDTPEALFITQNLQQPFVHYFTPIAEAIGAIMMGYSLSIIYKYV